MIIIKDDLTASQTLQLITEHFNEMQENSPAESMHALPIEALKQPDITFYSAWDQENIMGCGAIKELTSEHAEIKSMRTSSHYLRKGVARAILQHLIDEAMTRNYHSLSLETGAQESFKPAVKLYEDFGFTYCAPFGHYTEDSHSLFMTLSLINHAK